MKKLMMAVAIVCAAVVAQASSFNWSISSMTKVNVAGSSTSLYSGTAYLFDAATYTQATLLDAAVGTGIDFSKAVAQSGVTDGVLSGNSPTANIKNFSFGEDGDKNSFYMVIVNGDDTYVSATVTATGAKGKDTGVATKGTNSKNAAVEWTKGGTFSTAGWYATSSVPEPTSGLLLLLGMAGLALRRRRA